MEEFNLMIDKIEPISFSRYTVSVKKRDIERASFSLILGNAIVINGVTIEMDDYVMPGEKKETISINDVMTDAKFCDYPVCHFGKDRDRLYLNEQIFMGLNELVYGIHYEDICSFLKRRTNEFSDLRSFSERKRNDFSNLGSFCPKSWKGSIKVPVQFIRIYGVSERFGIIQAHIQIGHHIKMSMVKIYPEFNSRERILDKRIIDIVNKMLTQEGVKKRLEQYSMKRQLNSLNYDLIDDSLACHLKEIPPITFCMD
jgi:hypothetical protein